MRVLLIGPRGAGKSTVGPLLAERLGLPFLDADEEVERAEGATVAELFDAGRFRAAEREVLARLLAGPAAVVAAGGGAVLWEEFAERARGWRVIWLDAPGELLARRLVADPRGARPSLTGRAPEDEIGEVARSRETLYARHATWRVDTAGRSPPDLAGLIEKLLHRGRQARGPEAD